MLIFTLKEVLLKTKTLLRNYYIFLRDFLCDLFDDKIGHFASSLSWSTLFSIIPLLVIFLWVFATMPMFNPIHQQIETLIFSNLLPTNSDEVTGYINTFMKNSNQLGYVGAGYVTFAAILFLKTMIISSMIFLAFQAEALAMRSKPTVFYCL